MSSSPGGDDGPPARVDPFAARPDGDPPPEVLAAEAAQREWWDDASLPWKHKPTRADIACIGWVGFMGVFGLAMLPLRSWLLGLNPWLLVSLTGSRTGAAALGALLRVGDENLWGLALAFGVIMSIKFDWVFWWAGKLWGRGMIEVWAGQSPRAARHYARAERWARRFGWVGMFIAYIPIPLPLMQVIFVLAGAQGWSLRKFLGLDALASLVWLAFYLGFGWVVGEPAVVLLRAYAQIAQYVAIALVVVVVVSVVARGRRTARA